MCWSPLRFSKTSQLSVSLIMYGISVDLQPEMLYNLFLIYVKVKDYHKVLNLFLKALLKTKSCGRCLTASFSA